MSNSIPVSSQPKKLFQHRNVSGELDVFEAARYFAGATENNSSDTRKNISVEARIFNTSTRPLKRVSLDMPTHRDRGDHIPLQTMLMENRMVNNKDNKKFKQPSSPGGKLAHFLNSLFNQTSSKKSKSKSKSTKDEDESPGGWRRKRRSSISHFGSGNSTTTTTITTTATTATIMNDLKSPFSISASSGFRTPPPYHIAHKPIKTTSYNDPKSYSHLKPPTTQNTKTPINANLNKIETFKIRSDFYDKNTGFHNGFLEKVKIFDEKQENMKEFKRFIDNDDGGDSDSSSDLFELTSCDLGSRSSGLPVYETTRMVSIKRGASISS